MFYNSIINFFLQNGIVHRDLKLENILLDYENNAKVEISIAPFIGIPIF